MATILAIDMAMKAILKLRGATGVAGEKKKCEVAANGEATWSGR